MTNFKNKITIFFLNRSLLVILILLVVLMTIASDKFFSVTNFLNILSNYSITAIIAFGVAILLIAGAIDISFGSMISICAVAATFLSKYPVWIMIVLTIILGALLGMTNGVIVAKIGVEPLIATLATQGLFYAALALITGDNFVGGSRENKTWEFIGSGKIFGIPILIFIMIAVFLIVWFVLNKTLFGKFVYAHGSNKEALNCSGINPSRILFISFIFMGIIIGIVGILLSARLGGVLPIEGLRYLYIVLTAVILGGIGIRGGVGSLTNVLIAVFILGIIDNAMVLLSVAYKYQQMIRGLIFIFSVYYNNIMLSARSKFEKKYLRQIE
ncbi:MAG: ABC transporter permease [Actinobacteria bacterium]|nr:ABC transporter permease [Actinomycetota bacterium]